MFLELFRKAFIGGYWATCIKNIKEEKYHLIKNPKGFWIADPFIIEFKNNLYMIGEFYDIKNNIGKIGIALIVDYEIKFFKILTDNKTHMSYPFVCRKDNKFFVLPENSQNNVLDLYELDMNELKLKFIKHIFEGRKLVDCSLMDHYLCGYSEHEKSLYYCLINDSFEIISDFFKHEKSLEERPAGNGDAMNIKPFQQNGKKYGESIVFKNVSFTNGILFLKDVDSMDISHFNIDSKIRFSKIHTYNKSNNYIIIDVFHEKFDILRWHKMIKRRKHKE